jgi:nucleotide-binding universal stress UspA family protein
MPIKNLLLHMANDDRHQQRLDLALKIARRHGSHIHICFFTQPESMPAAVTGRGASYAYIAEATAIAREKAEKLRHEIEQKVAGIDWSFETLEDDHVEAMARRTYLADLAIVSQTNHATKADQVSLHLPDRLTLVSACPTLVLPHEPSIEFEGKHLMLAWKPTRESSRALRDGLSMMGEADKRTAVLLYEDDSKVAAEAEAEQLRGFLGNHKLDVEIVLEKAGKNPIGTILLDKAVELKADAIIMGGYSHSRLREMVLGGVTRHMLHNTTVPLVMSH